MHYGRKGMKWGQSVFGKNNIPHPTKKKVSSMSDTDLNNTVRRLKKEQEYKSLTAGPDKLRGSKEIVDSTRYGFEGASRAAGSIAYNAKPSKKVQQELSQMSDQELRQRINRMNMEQQYANLNPSKTAVGASKVKTALEVAGGIAVIGSSALAIAISIRDLKKKK